MIYLEDYISLSDVPQGMKYVIVCYRVPLNDSLISNIEALSGSVKVTYQEINSLAVLLPEDVVDVLRRDPLVKYVTDVKPIYPIWAEAQAFNYNWDMTIIGVPDAHKITKGKDVKVAVIDSGIDFTHPDLRVKGGKNFTSDVNGHLVDKLGHGTHVAGTIAAQADSSHGVIGIAPECSLYSLKVFDGAGAGSTVGIVGAILWAANNGMHVTNMSLGAWGEEDQSFHDAIIYAFSMDVIQCAAAGNYAEEGVSADETMPAMWDETICVGAVDKDKIRASFSQTGNSLDCVAPGVAIYSTTPTYAFDLEQYGVTRNFGFMDGTSMATPHVAGACALIRATFPDATGMEIRSQLLAKTEDLENKGWDRRMGLGLINVYRSVSEELVKETVEGGKSKGSPRGWAPSNLPAMTMGAAVITPSGIAEISAGAKTAGGTLLSSSGPVGEESYVEIGEVHHGYALPPEDHPPTPVVYGYFYHMVEKCIWVAKRTGTLGGAKDVIFKDASPVLLLRKDGKYENKKLIASEAFLDKAVRRLSYVKNFSIYEDRCYYADRFCVKSAKMKDHRSVERHKTNDKEKVDYALLRRQYIDNSGTMSPVWRLRGIPDLSDDRIKQWHKETLKITNSEYQDMVSAIKLWQPLKIYVTKAYRQFKASPYLKGKRYKYMAYVEEQWVKPLQMNKQWYANEEKKRKGLIDPSDLYNLHNTSIEVYCCEKLDFNEKWDWWGTILGIPGFSGSSLRYGNIAYFKSLTRTYIDIITYLGREYYPIDKRLYDDVTIDFEEDKPYLYCTIAFLMALLDKNTPKYTKTAFKGMDGGSIFKLESIRTVMGTYNFFSFAKKFTVTLPKDSKGKEEDITDKIRILSLYRRDETW